MDAVPKNDPAYRTPGNMTPAAAADIVEDLLRSATVEHLTWDEQRALGLLAILGEHAR